MNYKLLTPGPLTTTETVKSTMMCDHCTWDDEYKQITQSIRAELLKLGEVDSDEYTAVLMQGSGTFGVESVISSIVGADEKILFLTNGAYGDRMVQIAKSHKINNTVYNVPDNETFDIEKLRTILDEETDIDYIAVVHSETTTGIMNDIKTIGKVAKEYNKKYFVDAMSSFGGINLPINDWGIDFLVSSANKCIQGVPGFSFVIARKYLIEASKGNARTLSLDLYDQYKTMDKDGKWRYTSPTHTVLAFKAALAELRAEGGIEARNRRYQMNNDILISSMNKLGFKSYIDKSLQGPFITSFLFPEEESFNFNDMYSFIKERGFVTYPGKLTDIESFRIGNIGEIYPEDIEKLVSIIEIYMNRNKLKSIEAVIFDWAGTTIDFGCMAPVAAFSEAFMEKGIEVTEEEVREPMGMLKIDHIREMLKTERISKLWKEKYSRDWTEDDVKSIYKISEDKLLSTVANFTDIKPYLLETIEKLRNKGIKIGSTTGYTEEMMNIVVEKAKANGYSPDYWITPNSVNNMGRPYPYMIFKNLEVLGIKSVDKAVKIGDTISDITEGKNAGLISIGILEGSSLVGFSKDSFEALDDASKEILMDNARAKYYEADADYVINNLSELNTLLNI